MVAVAVVSPSVEPVTSVPSKVSNWPRTLLIRCRTVKPTSEWEGSMVQVPAMRPDSVTTVISCSSSS